MELGAQFTKVYGRTCRQVQGRAQETGILNAPLLPDSTTLNDSLSKTSQGGMPMQGR